VYLVPTGDIIDDFLTVIRCYKRQNNRVRTERGQNYCGNQSLSHVMLSILLQCVFVLQVASAYKNTACGVVTMIGGVEITPCMAISAACS